MAISDLPQQFLPHRQLLIFGNEQHSLLVDKQATLFKEASGGVEERALKAILVREKNPLYIKYKVAPGTFTVILIGKDGTEKYRANKVVPMNELFAIIDAMPMRKAEVKNKR